MAHKITTQEENILQPPFKACPTDEPYVFVSYAHKDKALVYPEIERLHNAGYRIWYDQGIKPTKDWAANIEEVLKGCTFFVVYISPNSMESENVKDEVHLAINTKMQYLAIHLHKTTLPDGLNMRMSRFQAILKYDLTPESYWLKLLDTLPLTTYASHVSTTSVSAVPPPPVFSPAPQLGDIKINPNDGAKMVYVPAGPFTMGDIDINDNPVRTMELPAYWVYQTPVTVAQYHTFCQATGRDMPPAPLWGWLDTHPIVNVSWYDATAYATLVGATLPTETEWEKAARGIDNRDYPWGNEWVADMCISRDNSGGMTGPVGSKPAGASPYGALDMVGNVWQWCADWYDNAQTMHSLRGGSWDHSGPWNFWTYGRNKLDSAARDISLGFRCVVHPSGP
ncbi:MAG: SUMF1/EgtB/PvdO family nonheme iron enzyme [bacterium]